MVAQEENKAGLVFLHATCELPSPTSINEQEQELGNHDFLEMEQKKYNCKNK